MTPGRYEARLAAAQWESDRHCAALEEALADWQKLPTPSSAALDQDSAIRRLTDQILYRFTKLQDTMGERLVPATLDCLLEPHDAWPMRDRLDRLEKLGFLDVDDWMAWRNVRNRLSHEYPDAPELRHAALLAAINAARALMSAYRRWKARLPA